MDRATISMDTSRAGLVEYIMAEPSDNQYDHDPKQPSALTLQQVVNPKPAAYFNKPGRSYKSCKDLAGNEVIPVTLEGKAPFYLEIDIKHQNGPSPETLSFPNIATNDYLLHIPHHALSLGTHHVNIRKVRDANGCQQKIDVKASWVQVQVFDAPSIYPMESRSHYCVGERISYALSGQAPFEIQYTFQGSKKVAKSQTTNFKRIAEKPGNFTIIAVTDKTSNCKAEINMTKVIHEMPSVKVSKGRQMKSDIHEGGRVDILFEFWGTPPFEFTWTRSSNAKKGQRSEILETRHEVSQEHSMTIQASQEGTYEVVAIKDKFCAFSTQQEVTHGAQKLLQF